MTLFVITADSLAVNIHRKAITLKEAWTQMPEPDSDDPETLVEPIEHPAQMRPETDDELIARVGRGGFVYEGVVPPFFKADFEKQTISEIARPLSKADVNAAVLENLKLIWGGETQNSVALKHQNAVGILARLMDKEVSEGAAPTSAENEIKERINGQLEAHEKVLAEGRRIKALSPIPADYQALLQGVL